MVLRYSPGRTPYDEKGVVYVNIEILQNSLRRRRALLSQEKASML